MVDIESPPCAAHDLVLMQYNQKFFEPAASTTYTGMAFMYWIGLGILVHRRVLMLDKSGWRGWR